MQGTPHRVQLRRTKGWRLPAGTVNCARPGIWGSPFPVAEYGLDVSLALFENAARAIWSPAPLASARPELVERAYEQFTRFMARLGGRPLERARSELSGRNLACWCSDVSRCHVDTWLRIANT